MTTYREAIYMCLDLLKGMSDDFSYTEEHVAYLLDKFRALLLKQRYGSDPKKHVPYSNYQDIGITFNLIHDSKKEVVTSTKTIPFTLQLGIPRITVDGENYYSYKCELVSRERFPFVGNNKYTKQFIYFTIDNDGYVLCKTTPEQWYSRDTAGIELKPCNFTITAILENPRDLITGNYLDVNIPIEEGLVTTLIEMVVKELAGSMYIPNDDQNNAKDDKADIYSFLAKNIKSDLAKQLS